MLAGFTATYVFTTLFAFFEYATPWVLLATVFINLTGGIATFMSVALCYITDSTSEHDRGGRYYHYNYLALLTIINSI